MATSRLDIELSKYWALLLPEQKKSCVPAVSPQGHGVVKMY